MKRFAVLRKVDSSLVCVRPAEKGEDLHAQFPPAQYRFVDMTGKGNPPGAIGLRMEDITVNEDGDWEIKPEWNAPDIAAATVISLRRSIVSLTLQKDKAEAMGGDYAALAGTYEADIADLEAKIDELTP